MLFNSYIFVFLFLPLVLIGYYGFWRFGGYRSVLLFLTAMSFLFYGYSSLPYLFLLFISILVNYIIVQRLQAAGSSFKSKQRLFLITGIVWNVGLLFYFKYYDFFIENLNTALHTGFPLLELLLPLGISFYTFQQLSWLIDAYRGEGGDYSFPEYLAYASFFPMISSGPIVYHHELIPQLRNSENGRLHFENLSRGLYSFALGLAKKVLIADSLAKVVTIGYDSIPELNSFSAVMVILCYSLQLYFDFSGYCDMVLGITRMMNLTLPVNFNSPYKAESVSDFWDRWHMTLTRFFTKYIYIPLGGSRKGNLRTYLNVMLVFFISGLWHGANWTFLLWGLLHGAASVLEKAFRLPSLPLPRAVKRMVTFTFVTLAWAIFRAPSLTDAFLLFGRLFSGGFSLYQPIRDRFLELIEVSFLYRLGLGGLMESYPWLTLTVLVILLLIACFTLKNTQEKVTNMKFSTGKLFITVGLLVWSILSLSEISEFLYFTF